MKYFTNIELDLSLLNEEFPEIERLSDIEYLKDTPIYIKLSKKLIVFEGLDTKINKQFMELLNSLGTFEVIAFYESNFEISLESCDIEQTILLNRCSAANIKINKSIFQRSLEFHDMNRAIDAFEIKSSEIKQTFLLSSTSITSFKAENNDFNWWCMLVGDIIENLDIKDCDFKSKLSFDSTIFKNEFNIENIKYLADFPPIFDNTNKTIDDIG